jgi:hypothetical protein
MIFSLIRKARRSARYAVLPLLLAAVFLAGAAYGDLTGQATIPSADDGVVTPIQHESSFPSLFPTKPVRNVRTLDDDQLAQDRQMPADHDNCVTGTSGQEQELRRVAIVAPRIAPEDEATQQLAYVVPYIPSLTGK